MILSEIQLRIAQAHAPGRWMAFFAADDIAQEIALAEWLYPTPRAQDIAIGYAMRRLRHELFGSYSKVPRVPAALRPSKQKSRTGYRANPEAKRTARLKIPAERRTEIARMGARRANGS